MLFRQTTGGVYAEEKGADIRYTVQWEGIEKHLMEEVLKATARSETLRAYPPPSVPLLRKRMLDDLPRLHSVLQAYGYYEARVEADLQTNPTPYRIRFVCDPGPRYTIGVQTVTYVGDTPPRANWKPFLQRSDAASTNAIQRSEQWMIRFFKTQARLPL